LVDRLKSDTSAGDFCEDVVGGDGPDKRFRLVVVGGEVVLDLGDQVGVEIIYPPSGVQRPRREGGLWSFMKSLD